MLVSLKRNNAERAFKKKNSVYLNRPNHTFPIGREKLYVVNLPTEERVAWIWCLLLAFIVPEIGTLIRSLRICFFKSCKKPQLFDFVFVLVMETLHVFGLVMLVYVVLPNLDVIKGAMLTNCLCFVPALLSKLILLSLLIVDCR